MHGPLAAGMALLLNRRNPWTWFADPPVESTVNQVISKRFYKKQQMAWTQRGAHLLLQICTRVLKGDWEATFREWCPGFRATPRSMAA